MRHAIAKWIAWIALKVEGGDVNCPCWLCDLDPECGAANHVCKESRLVGF